MPRPLRPFAAALFAVGVAAASADAQSFSFSTGGPDGRLGIAARPGAVGQVEIEAGDDFVLGRDTRLTSATFTGLLPFGVDASAADFVRVQIYRVFPDESGPPSGTVPTRVNSPGDVAFATRESGAGLSFSATVLANDFAAANSVRDGIFPIPNFQTGGEGAVRGQLVQFTVSFLTPIGLPADHFFFVPQVGLTGGADFFWLSAARPMGPGGTPFAGDLQAWIRNEDLAPDWLRIGTDIIGPDGDQPAPTFNAAFTLEGTEVVPEPSTVVLLASGLGALGWMTARRRRTA